MTAIRRRRLSSGRWPRRDLRRLRRDRRGDLVGQPALGAQLLTTNGVSASRSLTVIAISRDGAQARAGVVARAGVGREQIPDLVAEAEKAAAEGSPADDAQPLVGPAAGRPGSRARRGTTRRAAPSRVLRGFASALGGAFDAAATGGRGLYGYAEHPLTSRPRHLHRAAAAARSAIGKGRAERESADLTRSAWAGAGTRDFADVDVAALEADLARRLGWADRQVELPAGRYETLLPPTAVADLLIYLYWSSGAKDAVDGRTVFSKPGGGTRVGERLASLPLTLRSDPGAPGLECAPFVIAHAPAARRRCSTTACRSGPPSGSAGASWPR